MASDWSDEEECDPKPQSKNLPLDNVCNLLENSLKLDDTKKDGNQYNKEESIEKDLNNNNPGKIQLKQFSQLVKERIESKKNLEIIRIHPESPLYSIKNFDELYITDDLLKGIYSMGFQKPSHVQETVLPLIIANPPSNLIAQSQSGTGKTAAFLIGSLKRIEIDKKYPQVLVLAPTLELALQIGDVARRMSKYTDIKVKNAVKGETRPGKIEEHVVIGTPGKLTDWIFRFHSFDIKKIKVFILDEADIMINTQGHQTQSIKIQKELNESCQLLLFSATFEQEVLDFAECIITNPIIIRLKREEECLDNVNQFYAHCRDEDEKYSALADIFGNIVVGQTIIFCKTRKSALFLKNKLENDGHKVGLLTGELETQQRLDIIKKFRDGDERVLITTNLTSRGIDIDQVTLVINYDLPFDVFKKDVDFEVYLHRIGRCGRFGKPGFAVSLIDTRKGYELDQIKKIEDHFMKPINELDTTDPAQFKEWE